ncbi:putative T-complex protein 1 subunit gamma [Paratrimastix pyriformis]|uniref:T-complex protein 1 subunit gamma n=1 Tax=Paratrimastix pyriformis TaxID=342808 RepID=A0ABQ8UV95_9EUKA|nr:putative T-complex protein 1 subunit gamma [Paratrimastix pyriformis]|eukprot:GAFH01001243.1.p2 GENE.GAFH01001243.1~~GAFH01001243.1.p2  ORF type:complete len:573 (-),score=186.03 GAFH01001243.1:69-1763(-)
MQRGPAPQVMVLNPNSKRETGRKAQLANIRAGKEVADLIRTCLGPRAMLKMLIDNMGGILMTNDGHSILREVDINHPAARTIIQLSRAQDEEVGDGTTSVIVLAGEILAVAQPLLERNLHPTIINSAYQRALTDALEFCKTFARPVDVTNEAEMYKIIRTTLSTKFAARWMDQMCRMALQAVLRVAGPQSQCPQAGFAVTRREIDLKRYAKVEKIPGGEIEQCEVLDGVMFSKDIVHPAMRRRIENPRVVLLDSAIEYKKAESATNVILSKEEDFATLLKQEEEEIKAMVDHILAVHPDVVVTEKGLSDLAAHFFVKAGVTAIRRLRKTDNNRIARATGATIVNRTEELKDADVGTGCGLFEVKKIGDEYFTYFVHCREPKACSIILRGASKDVLNEIERNLQDAMYVARNVVLEPRLLPGGGATEMAVATYLGKRAATIQGTSQWPYQAVAQAFEVIPRTLAENCGVNVIRCITQLRAKHHESSEKGELVPWGLDGLTGNIVDMRSQEIWEPMAVKIQTFKSAIESACLLLRIDDIVSGVKKSDKDKSGPSRNDEDMTNPGDE